MYYPQKTETPYRPNVDAMIAKANKDFAERPAREAALHEMVRQFACDYGTAAVGKILREATGGRV